MEPLTKLAIPYAELNAKTNYSFLQGASHPEEMVEEAHALGYRSIAITDHNGVYGIPRAHQAAERLGIHLIVGAEIQCEGLKVILLCQDKEGYGNLCELLTKVHRDMPFDFTDNLFNKLLALIPVENKTTNLSKIKDRFPDQAYLLASHFHDGSNRFAAALAQAKQYGLPILASNQPLFHQKTRKPLQDVLTCLQHQCTLKEAGFRLQPNLERHLKSIPELGDLYSHYPEWISRTLEVAERCRFSCKELKYQYPSEWLPPGETGDSYLRKLVEQRIKERYPGTPSPKTLAQIEHELLLIKELSYSDYFLTIWDIVQFAKSKQILYQGRGSAANSIVCYLLEITAIDPIRMDLLFERFISRERKEPPDIDIDFEHERREEVIQYIYERYGRERAAITAENICLRRRSAIREVAKAFAIPLPITERFLSLSHKRSLDEIPIEEWEAMAPDLPLRQLKQYLKLTSAILSFPRHLGTHVGGFVLSQDKLTRKVPIENAAMPNRSIVQWDKNDLDSLGFTRVDILGLGILTCIRKCFTYLKEIYGISLSLATVPAEDPVVYESMSRGDTIGVFQIESRAQMNMLPRLKPKTFFDLVIEISIVRPGPIQGEMVHPYLKRRNGEEKIIYPHPKLEAILKKTCGVPLFQEQIMKMAMEVAGFSGGEADELRRAMGTWRRDQNKLAQVGKRFHEGLIKNGISKHFADQIFNQISGFAEYGFPESHAASFALLAYATAYLKHYYPDAYLAAILNSQPMGFYQSHTLIHDALRHQVQVLPIDIQKSQYDNQLVEKSKVRLGFREIKSLPEKTGRAIEALPKPFQSFHQFVQSLQEALHPQVLTRRELFHLAGANAFSSMGLSRRDVLWEIQALPLKDSHLLWSEPDQTILPPEETWETIALDYETVGVSLYKHPMDCLRSELHLKGLKSSQEVWKEANGRKVTAGGIVVSRQMPPTANGVLFITLEDEFGFINLVIWNQVYQNYRLPLISHSFLMVEGKIQRAPGANVVHLIVDAAYPLLPGKTPALSSHDFH